jgi:outer membrane protein OmpA-like peptidoglycan-associated protein
MLLYSPKPLIVPTIEEEHSVMRTLKYLPLSAVLIAGAAPAVAQDQALPTIEMVSSSFHIGIGGQSGEGILRLPNLGTNCAYRFKVDGFGAGIRVGISKASAAGVVANMTKVSDLAGHYSATEGEATLIAGAGSTSMKNENNSVVIGLKSRTEGLSLGFGGQGITIQVTDPVINGQRGYFLTFGFDKTNINQESRAILSQVVRDWKCRYATIHLYGHTDTVGHEHDNLDLAAQRAIAARNYLIGAGIAPSRVLTASKGEDMPLMPTPNDTRLRTNRNVVVSIQE